MEVIPIEADGRSTGKYDVKKLIDSVRKALKEGERTGKMAGFHLDSFIKEVYSGESPNLGALRKKIQEVSWKHQLGEIGISIREKDNIIGFYIKK